MTDGVGEATDAPAGVLICDDYLPARRLLAIVLERAGLEILGEVADGDEAVREATRLQPQLITLDLAMPKRSGIDALPELRRVAPSAKIIVLSAFASSVTKARALELGADAYIEKGMPPDAIVTTISAVLASER